MADGLPPLLMVVKEPFLSPVCSSTLYEYMSGQSQAIPGNIWNMKGAGLSS